MLKAVRLFSLYVVLGVSTLWVAPSHAMADYADLVEKLSPSVVNISIKTKTVEEGGKRGGRNPFSGTPFEDFFKEFEEGFQQLPIPQRRKASLGSGVVIDLEGYIITNNHVIEDAAEIIVKFNEDREDYEAELIGRDAKNDIALLKLKDKVVGLSAARLGDSDALRPGEAVLAIGNPFGLGGTVTAGIVSALGRNIGQGPYDDFIQTDAAINPGNSGGPLFNKAGEVIGINTAIISRTGGSNGIGFAVPVNTVKKIVSQIKQYGRPVRGWLGVRIQHITEDLAESLKLPDDVGALVAEVVEGSPAEKAKIKSGDVILSYNGTDIIEMSDLPRLVAETPVGKRVPVEVLRDKKRRTLYIKIAELEEDEDVAVPGREAPTAKPEKLLGLTLRPLTNDIRKTLELEKSMDGLVADSVAYGSPAFEAGIRTGDVLVSANMKDLTGLDVLRTEVNRSKGKSLLIRLYRQDGYLFVPLKVEDE